MNTTMVSLTHLSDTELLSAVTRAAAEEREATTNLIALLAELDTRRLYLAEGYSSLFTYCTQVLHLSEHAAYGRIEVARTARRFPVVLDLLADGAVTLTTIGLLAPHLTSENANTLLTAARHQSKREVEHLVAALRPLPPVPSSVRKLPMTSAKDMPSLSPAPSGAAILSAQAGDAVARGRDACEGPVAGPPAKERPVPIRPVAVTPLSPERYKVQFTVSREAYETLRRAQDLLRHVIPSGDPAAIFERALSLLVADLERTRLASTTQPRRSREAPSGSRHVPAAVTRQVWARDGGQCAFVGTRGRCLERGGLEIHHVVPFADGGPTVADNLSLRCHQHNAYEAEQWFGPPLVREARSTYSINSVRTEDVRRTSVRACAASKQFRRNSRIEALLAHEIGHVEVVGQEPARSLIEIAYVGRRAEHLFGAYNVNQAEFRSNGFLDAFNVVKAGGESALMNQLVAPDTRRNAGESGSAMVRRLFASRTSRTIPSSAFRR